MSGTTETGLAKVNGTSIYYELRGSGEPVVLIHGGFGDLRYWNGQFNALAKRYRVLRYDIRGFGKSAMPPEDEPYNVLEDLLGLLENFNFDPAHLVGYSMGSRIAVNFALAYPDRCKSLCLVGPVVSGFSSAAFKQWRRAVATIIPVYVEKGQPAAGDHAVDVAFQDLGCDAATIEKVREIMRGYSYWHYTHRTPGRPAGLSAIERLGEIRVPVLTVTAERDLEFCRETAEMLTNAVPQAQKKVLNGAGHFMPMEKPAEINQIIMEFLDPVASEQV